MTAKKETFENLYRQLEETVEKLEAGGLNLEEALALYAQGMDLARKCQEILDTAELKITRLKEAIHAEAAPTSAEDEADVYPAVDEPEEGDDEC